MTNQLAVVSLEQLTALVREAVRAELAARFPPEPRPGRLTVTEAAEELRCSGRHVRKLVAQGRLRAEKASLGGSSRTLIPRAEIERLLTEAR